MSVKKDNRALLSKSLKSHVMVCYALLEIAEGELRDGKPDCAHRTVGTIRRLIGETNILIDEPHSLSPGAVRETAELVADLQNRLATFG